MNKRNKPYIFTVILTIAFALSLAIPEDGFSRRGGFGGGRSFRTSRSSSWGSSRSKSKSAWSSSKTKKMSSKRSQSESSRLTKTDKALYKKAKAKGTVYNSRADAKKAFNSKYSQQYPSKYSSKPATRPDHIPRTARANGRDYPVEYNPRYGGYGYMGPGGGWIAYNVMRDAVMLNLLMTRNHYYYGARPVAYGGVGGAFWTGIIVVGIIIFFAVILRR